MDIRQHDDTARSGQPTSRFRQAERAQHEPGIPVIERRKSASYGQNPKTPHDNLTLLLVLVVICLVLTLLALYLNVASAAVYHWIDEDGRPHYSQSTPHRDTGIVTTVPLDDTLMSGTRQDLPVMPSNILRAYCNEIADSAEKEARRMIKSSKLLIAHQRALTRSDDRAKTRVKKQLVSHVLAYRNTGTSADEIAELAANQCIAAPIRTPSRHSSGVNTLNAMMNYLVRDRG